MSLKSVLKSLIGSLGEKKTDTSRAMSFDEYKASRGLDYESTYHDGVKKAYNELATSAPGYGQNAENLYQNGLSHSGYAEYLEKKSKGSYLGAVKSLYDNKEKSEKAALGGYASYLSGYESARNSRMSSVRNDLIKNNIINRDTAFNYAIDAGLTEKEANKVTEAVYDLSRERIMADVISKAAGYRISGDAAAALAMKMGLSEEDSLLIKAEVDKYSDGNEITDVSDEYLGALEDLADHLNSTTKNKKGND